MQQYWFKDHPDKEQRKKQVRTYKPVLDDLKEVIQKNLEKKPCVRNYEEPNWELRQIAVNEYNQVLEDIIKLITIKD